MNKFYLVVTSKEVAEGMHEMSMSRFYNEGSAMECIGNIATNQKDPRELERVFSVDIYGEVTYYEVVYSKGKLKLQTRNKRDSDVNPDPEGKWTF